MGLATRIIPSLLWSENGCVKGKQFSKDRRIGSIQDRIRLIERRDVDELIILDVSKLAPRFEEVSRLCEPLFCPITIGGGISNVSDIRRLLAGGADKVSINSRALARPEFITEAAHKFGSQAIVVSIDVRPGEIRIPPDEYAADCEKRGAGEILLTSVERDGMMCGYDLELIEKVANAVSIPVIAAGGCGSYEHMQQALDAGAHAVASGAFFQFCDATPKEAARYLKTEGFQTRT